MSDDELDAYEIRERTDLIPLLLVVHEKLDMIAGHFDRAFDRMRKETST